MTRGNKVQLVITYALALLLTTVGTTFAQDPPPATPELIPEAERIEESTENEEEQADVEELERRVDLLAEELERLIGGEGRLRFLAILTRVGGG